MIRLRRFNPKLFVATPVVLLLTSCAAVGLLTSCVSVNLPTNSGKKSTDVRYDSPEGFQNFEAPGTDHAWVRNSSGNTISYLSDCESRIDPTLEQLQAESLNVLRHMKVEQQDRLPYNGRQAIVTTASGDVDGVPVKMKLLTLKKNDCNYTLTYTGVAERFSTDVRAFDKFTASFKAP